MRDALSILASVNLLPPSATLSDHHRRRSHRHSTTSTTTKPILNPYSNPKHKPQFSTTYPPLSSPRWDNRQSLTYYSDLASKLAKDGRFVDFLMIAESVVASGVNMTEFITLLDEECIANGVVSAIREGKVGSVLEMLFSGVRRLGVEPAVLFDGGAVELLKGECRRLLRCGEAEQLVSLVDTLAGFQFPIKELVEPSDVIKLCISKKDPTAAIRYAQNFPHAEVLFCSIILEYGKKRDLGSALKAFDASKQNMSSPNMHVYRTIIDVCGLCGDYLKSRAIYEGLCAENITPNIYVLNSLMNVNSRDLNYVLDIYKKMEKLGVTADITSYNILLKSCCLASKVKVAQNIYEEICDLESKGALKLDVFTYSTMLKVFADAKKWENALEIKEDMVSSGITLNKVAWSSLISACANAGHVEQALMLFDEMLQAGCQPNSQCFNILLHGCVEVCQFDRAFRLFESWKGTRFPKTITDDNQRGLPSRVYEHLTAKVPFKPTTATYNIMMKACGTDYLRAKALMDEMNTFGLSPNHISWSILIDICGSSGSLRGALQILSDMHESGTQPDVIAYTTAIKICVQYKNPKLAFKLFGDMKKYQIKPNMVTYNTILRARSVYGSLQEVQQCLEVYQHMRKAGYKSNDYYLKQLIEEWCEGVIQNEHQNKGQFASNITDFGRQSLLLEKVAEHLHDNNAESLSIDLRDLAKVEARIVVLAVLRRIKEKCTKGNPIKDDLSIILGHQQLGACVTKDESGIREAVTRLLQHDLGLQVFAAGSSTMNRDKGSPMRNLEDVDERSRLAQASESPTRRPIVLQRLNVTRKSLLLWLQRTGSLTR